MFRYRNLRTNVFNPRRNTMRIFCINEMFLIDRTFGFAFHDIFPNSVIEISFGLLIAWSDISDSVVLLTTATPPAIGEPTATAALALTLTFQVLIEACGVLDPWRFTRPTAVLWGAGMVTSTCSSTEPLPLRFAAESVLGAGFAEILGVRSYPLGVGFILAGGRAPSLVVELLLSLELHEFAAFSIIVLALSLALALPAFRSCSSFVGAEKNACISSPLEGCGS